MTEARNPEPEQIWETLSDSEKKACVYFTVSDWRTGVGRDYIDAMGIGGKDLDELVKRGVVETKPTWKMFQDEADKLEPEVQTIRGRVKDFTYHLKDSERKTLSTYDNFVSVAGRKSEDPRFRLADINLHNYINVIGNQK